jgi:hypothetical protein
MIKFFWVIQKTKKKKSYFWVCVDEVYLFKRKKAKWNFERKERLKVGLVVWLV